MNTPTASGATPQQHPQSSVPLALIADAVGRRGYLTTEWWTTVLAALLSAALGLVGLHGPAAAQVTGILAPVLVAGVYALVRTRHKSVLAQLAAAAFPQAQPGPARPAEAAGGPAGGGPAGSSPPPPRPDPARP